MLLSIDLNRYPVALLFLHRLIADVLRIVGQIVCLVRDIVSLFPVNIVIAVQLMVCTLLHMLVMNSYQSYPFNCIELKLTAIHIVGLVLKVRHSITHTCLPWRTLIEDRGYCLWLDIQNNMITPKWPQIDIESLPTILIPLFVDNPSTQSTLTLQFICTITTYQPVSLIPSSWDS